MAEGQIKAWRRFGHDVLMLENGTAALAEACGVRVQYQRDSAPVAKEPAIKSLSEVSSLKVPDPYQDGLLSELLKTTRIVVGEIGDEAFIMGRADQGPFSLACEIRGMSQFLTDLATGEQEAEIEQLLDFCRQVAFRYAVAQMEQGAHCTSFGDSSSGPDLVSPRYHRKYAYPYMQRLGADLNAKGIRWAYHICGNATPIIDDMVSTGPAIIEIDQKVDLSVCKTAVRHRSALLGPVDPSGVMALGTPEEVRQKCTEALDLLAPDHGFILGAGCALPPTTPDENMDVMIEAARRHRVPQSVPNGM